MAIDKITRMYRLLHDKIVLFGIEQVFKGQRNLVDHSDTIRLHTAHITPAVAKGVVLVAPARDWRVCIYDLSHGLYSSRLRQRAKFRQGDLWRHIVEDYCDREPHTELLGIKVQHMRDQAHAFCQLDDDSRIGYIRGEARVQGPVNHCPAKDLAPATGTLPAPVERTASSAALAWHVAPGTAVLATLETQLVLFAELIKLPVEIFAAWQGFGVVAHAHLRRIARLPSPKSPQPVTNPTSQSGTWSAASWRNCRVASTT